MKKLVIVLILFLKLYSLEIPFDANFRATSKDTCITYSTRLNLLELNSSRIILISEQIYDVGASRRTKYSNIIKYIYYW